MKIVFGDLEANGLLSEASVMHCAVFKDSVTKQVVKFRPHQAKESLAYLDTVDVLIMHNGIGYDLPLLKKLYGYEFKGKVVDTLLMSRLLNPGRLTPPNCLDKSVSPHSLAAWGYRVGRGKPEHNDWSTFSEDMLHRCTEDVEILALVYEALLKEAEGGQWRNAFLLTFDLFKWLHIQEQNGWEADVPHMQRCVEHLTRRIANIDRVISPRLPTVLVVEEAKKTGEYSYVKKPFLKSGAYSETVSKWFAGSGSINDVGGCFSRISFRKTNLDSGEEMKEFLLAKGWEPLKWNTDSEGKRTSPKMDKEDPFEGIEGKLGRLVVKRVQCRQRRGIIEGLMGLVRDDGRIASSVNTLAVTGRATHRGIVNIPKVGSFYGRHMREIFVARPGRVLVGTDSASCQIRMLCGRMKDPVYEDSVLNGDSDAGTDIHSVNMRKAGLPDRSLAKTFFFGFLFGAGDAKVGKIVKGTAEDGRRLKTAFLSGLPALQELISDLSRQWRSTAKMRYNDRFGKMEPYNGTIKGLDGRPILIPSEHQILVYMLQSDEAIMMSKAYCLLNERLSKRFKQGEDYKVVCFYHDECTVECKEEIAQEVKAISEKCIEDAGKFYKISCPHKGEGKIGKNWAEIH